MVLTEADTQGMYGTKRHSSQLCTRRVYGQETRGLRQGYLTVAMVPVSSTAEIEVRMQTRIRR